MIEHNPDLANDGLIAVPTDEGEFLLTASEDKLNYALLNNDNPAKAIIYITDKEGVNDLTFTARNATPEILKLRGGKTPPEYDPDDSKGPSTFYFFFTEGGLLLLEDVTKIQVCGRWAGKWFEWRNSAYFAICPLDDIELKSQDKLHTQLTKITTDEHRTDTGEKNLRIVGLRISGREHESPLKIQIARLGPKKLDLVFTPVAPNEVFISQDGREFKNTLGYSMTNKNDEAWGWPETGKPSFQWSFIMEDSDPVDGDPPPRRALTTLERAKRIGISPSDIRRWQCVNLDGAFMLNPNLRGEILGKEKSICFTLEDIITDIPPGDAHGRLYWYNIRGYQDGYGWMAVKRSCLPTVEFFKVQPTEPVDYGQQLTFHWKTFGGDKWELAAGSETLEAGQDMGERTRQLDAKHTKYSLTCLGRNIKHAQEAEVTIKPPRIEEFKASPDTFEYGGGQTTLSWRTGSTKEQFLQGKPVAREGEKPEDVKRTTEFKLVGKGIDKEEEKPATVTVKPPVIKSFTASMTEGVFFKEKITLSWEATGGTYRILENGAVHSRNLSPKSTLDVRAVSPTTGQQSPLPTATYTLEYDGDEHDVKCEVQIKMRRFNFPLLIAEHDRSDPRHLRRIGSEIKPDASNSGDTGPSRQFYLVPLRDAKDRNRFQIGVLENRARGEVWYLKGDSGWRYVNVAPKRDLKPVQTWFSLQPSVPGRIQVHYLEGAHENPEYLTTQGTWPLFRNKKSEGIDWHQIFNPHFQADLPFSKIVYDEIAGHFGEDWG